VVSPLSAVPKDGVSFDKIRVVQDASAGAVSPNSCIDLGPMGDMWLLQLQSVVRRVQFLRQRTPGCEVFMAKIDLAEAYRLFSQAVRDRWRSCHLFRGVFLMHTATMFGSRSAGYWTGAWTNAIADVMATDNHWCEPFVDDFVLIAGSRDECWRAVHSLRALLHELGLKENEPKFIEPAQHGILSNCWCGVRFRGGCGERDSGATRQNPCAG
jgi:hypothetical protein